MKNFLMSTVLASCSLAAAVTQAAGIPLVNMNVSGAEFNAGTLPGRAFYDYTFPSAAYLSNWKAKGITVIRLPVLWERLQPALNGPLDEGYAQLIDSVLANAGTLGMKVIVDLHNYGVYRTKVLGTSDVPLTAYTQLMTLMAARWNASPGLQGYDIMNEPHDAANTYWNTAAQAAINGLRTSDRTHPIYVEGRSWSSAANWPSLNGDLLLLQDPINKIIFSAHLYVDADASGTYSTLLPSTFDTNTGVNRATPFVQWLVANNRKGHLGEFGVPGNDPLAMVAMQKLLAYLQPKCVPLTYWAAGSWWGNYSLSIEPSSSGDRPQWPILKPFVLAPNSCS